MILCKFQQINHYFADSFMNCAIRVCSELKRMSKDQKIYFANSTQKSYDYYNDYILVQSNIKMQNQKQLSTNQLSKQQENISKNSSLKSQKQHKQLKQQTEASEQEQDQQVQTDHYNQSSYQPFKPDPKRFQKLFGFPKTDPYALFSPIHFSVYFEDHYYLDDKYKTSIYHSKPKQKSQNDVICICFHGAGSSALSFCQLTKQLKNMKCQIFAYDIIGHGETTTCQSQSKSLGLQITKLVAQGLEVYFQIKKLNPNKKHVFIGHSLGGSICCRIAKILLEGQEKGLLSVIIIDSIQGTAKQRFTQMKELYKQFPQQFSCQESAISWMKRSHLVRRSESARSCVPSQLTKIQFTTKQEQQKHQGKLNIYKWKVNMLDTVEYWLQWYDGLSKLIVDLPVEKILFTLNKERLDNALRQESQKQGTKLKVVYFQYSGHFIHQDEYEKCSQIIQESIGNSLK